MSDSVTPWTADPQAPLSMGCSRQEYWTGLPFPSPRDLPNPGIESGSPALHVASLLSEPPGKPLNILDQRLQDERLQDLVWLFSSVFKTTKHLS